VGRLKRKGREIGLQRAGGLVSQNQGIRNTPAGASMKEGPYGYLCKCRLLEELLQSMALKEASTK
jgi:hypothetical protein